MIATEYVVSERPLVIRRRVKWGDCDPAGVVYTPVFSEYVISAGELFYGLLFNDNWQKVKRDLGFETPSRTLSFDFQNGLRPEQAFDMTVTVADIRNRAYVLDIAACTLSGEPVFNATLTPVCVTPEARKSVDMPAVFRDALQRYQADCGRLNPLETTT